MEPSIIAVLITAAVSMGGSWIVARSAGRNIDLESRKVDHERIEKLETRVNFLEEKRRDDALTLRRMGDFVDELEAHIWQGRPPPPPPRPEGI